MTVPNTRTVRSGLDKSDMRFRACHRMTRRNREKRDNNWAVESRIPDFGRGRTTSAHAHNLRDVKKRKEAP
jgi:hypothetical protein